MKINRSLTYKYAIVLNTIKDRKLYMAIDSLLSLKDGDVKTFFLDPTISYQNKSKVLSEIFSLDERSIRFFDLLFTHKRFNLLNEIKDVAERISMRQHGLEKVYVRSAITLNEKDRQALIDAIKRVRKTEPILIVKEDPSLIAGVIMDFEDSIVDLSVSGALKDLELFIFGGR
ncbi:MAG: ATP synthase F1 subunit delta [Thermotogae bacterium]|jgi:F-type H+-transporting ATPase subunit delta|nr:ATP synthase F1 subunit delta [Thermotogota bacterium]MCL5032868.1 ATP synthase F1 subunit delta [Thermotogota bacterium]